MTPLLRFRVPLLIVGLLAALAYAVALPLGIDRALFFRAYLFSYLFCLGLALGSLCLLLLHNLTGGAWGDQTRPLARAAARTLPLLLLLFVPIALGLSHLYPWANPGAAAQNEIFAHRQPYLNVPFFLVRAVIYFAIWITLGLIAARENPLSRGLSAAGLILYLLTMTHAGIDWVMSREIDFYSTAFGFVITVGQTLSALALTTLLQTRIRIPVAPPLLHFKHTKCTKTSGPALLNDVGNVLLTLVILWIYVSFMEFLVIWMGNTRQDDAWFLQRGLSGNAEWPAALGWRGVGVAILVFHFLVPFYLLLFRKVKQNGRGLAAVGGMLLGAHALEQYWLVAPAGHGAGPRFDGSWVDGVALVGLLGIWLGVFLMILGRLPMAPAAPALPAEGTVAHE